jgi:hypothetical protein
MARRAYLVTIPVAVALAAFRPSACDAALGHELAPCSLLGRTDVTGLTRWHIDTIRSKRYAFNGASGAMCFYEAKQGTVIVIVPDRDSPYPGNSPFIDPGGRGSFGAIRRPGFRSPTSTEPRT